MMRSNLKNTLIVLIGGFLAVLMVGLALPYVASLGIWSSGQSWSLTSTGTAMNQYLPTFAILLMGCIVLGLFSSRR